MLVRIVAAAVVAFAIAFVLTPVFRNAARRRGLLDVPNEASSHTVPTPRNGGFAIVLGLIAGAALASDATRIPLLLGCMIANATLPAIDEFRPLSRRLRLVVQVALAAATLLLLEPNLSAIVDVDTIALVLAVIWLVAVVNAYNFMDGLNGLSSTAAVICGAATSVMLYQYGNHGVALVAAATSAAAAGFIPWNLPSGSVFMGDVGSATLGFVLALLSLLLIGSGAPPVVALLPLGSFCSDAFLAIIRRAVKGERFFATRHRSHFYQWLNQQGWSHLRVTALWDVLMVASAATAIAHRSLPHGTWNVMLVAVVVLHAVVFGWVAYRQRSAR